MRREISECCRATSKKITFHDAVKYMFEGEQETKDFFNAHTEITNDMIYLDEEAQKKFLNAAESGQIHISNDMIIGGVDDVSSSSEKEKDADSEVMNPPEYGSKEADNSTDAVKGKSEEKKAKPESTQKKTHKKKTVKRASVQMLCSTKTYEIKADEARKLAFETGMIQLEELCLMTDKDVTSKMRELFISVKVGQSFIYMPKTLFDKVGNFIFWN